MRPLWPENLLLRRVIYDRKVQKQLLMNPISSLLDELTVAEREQDADVAIGLVPKLLQCLSGLIWESMFCFKHPAFQEEKEWRWVLLRSRLDSEADPHPLVRRSQHGFVPYVELPIHPKAGPWQGRLPLNMLIVGPSPQPKLAKGGATALLRLHNYRWPMTEVFGSDVPLRV